MVFDHADAKIYVLSRVSSQTGGTVLRFKIFLTGLKQKYDKMVFLKSSIINVAVNMIIW